MDIITGGEDKETTRTTGNVTEGSYFIKGVDIDTFKRFLNEGKLFSPPN